MGKTKNNRFRYLTFRKVAIIVAITLFMTSCKKDEVLISPWYPETNANGDSIIAVYESRIPCPDCERLKFALAVYGNIQTNSPLTYMMSRVYVGKSDDRLTNSGDINIIQGTSLDSLHTVYKLVSGAPSEFKSFWKMNDDLLFILDDNLTPRVGDAGHGYVLNRIK